MRKILLPVSALAITKCHAEDTCTVADMDVMEQQSENILPCIMDSSPSEFTECYGGSELSEGCSSCLDNAFSSDKCKDIVCSTDNMESCAECMAETAVCSPVTALDSPADTEGDTEDTTSKGVTIITVLVGSLVSIAISLF
jgi:hypothetical protein